MYEHVIVPFDGTAEAQRAGMVGADLAQLFGAELLLTTAADLDGAELTALKQAAMARSDSHVTVWVEGSSSDREAVGTVIDHRRNSLICMYSNGRTGVRRAVYGSLAEGLLHDLDVPVVVLGPKTDGASMVNLRNMIVCVDGTATSDAAVALAIRWARLLPLNASVVHVRRGVGGDGVDLQPTVDALRTCCEMVEVAEPTGRHPVDGVLELARHSFGAVVVTATHGRARLDGLLQGSFTAELCRRSPLPVLVQRGPLPTTRPEWLGPAT